MSGIIAALSAGALSYDLFADSANGSDANTGATKSQALQSLSALSSSATTGCNIALVGGSSWAGMLLPANPPRKIGVIGTQIVKIDGGKAISVGAWSLHNDGSGLVYKATLGRDPSARLVGDDTWSIWENGAWLVRKLSVADVAATPGSYYFDPGHVTGSTTVLYLHVSDGSNPASNGKLYEQNYYSSALEVPAVDDLVVQGPLWIRRNLGADGSGVGGKRVTWKQVLFSLGSKHNSVSKSGTYEDCVAFDSDISILQFGGGSILYTLFDSPTAGLSFAFKRCLGIYPDSHPSTVGPAYAHGSGDVFENGVIDGFIVANCPGITAQVKNLYQNDVWLVRNCAAIAQLNDQTANYSILRNFIKCTGMYGGVINNDSDNTLTSVGEIAHCGIALSSSINNGWVLAIELPCATIPNIHHNTLFAQPITSYLGMLVDLSGAKAGSKFNNNIVIKPDGIIKYIQCPVANVSMDYNVYIDMGSGGAWGDTTGGGTNAFTLSQWRSLSGQDTHSVVLGASDAAALFLNGVDAMMNGDFRLNPAYTGTFTDGTPIVGHAGTQEYYDWTTRQVVSGQPERWPTPPLTEADCATYVTNPASWNFYP